METPASVISVDAGVMSGAPVFRGTRVPIAGLFDYLAAADPLEAFLTDFPTVTRTMALALIREAGTELLAKYGVEWPEA